MRLSAASICRHVVPPSSERYKPKLPIRNIRCALVFIATATDVRPTRRGKPLLAPVISVHVSPLSIDLNSLVCVGPVPPPPPPPPPPPAGGTRTGPVTGTT